jgi:hypothetical protein
VTRRACEKIAQNVALQPIFGKIMSGITFGMGKSRKKSDYLGQLKKTAQRKQSDHPGEELYILKRTTGELNFKQGAIDT